MRMIPTLVSVGLIVALAVVLGAPAAADPDVPPATSSSASERLTAMTRSDRRANLRAPSRMWASVTTSDPRVRKPERCRAASGAAIVSTSSSGARSSRSRAASRLSRSTTLVTRTPARRRAASMCRL